MRVAIEDSEPQGHVVQFYDHDQRLLMTNVSRYLGEGLRRGEGLIVIATTGHSKGFIQQLKQDGTDPEEAVREGRLAFRDAEETLARFMVAGQPDWERFENTAGALIREVRARSGDKGVRAYGEMVDLLWNA